MMKCLVVFLVLSALAACAPYHVNGKPVNVADALQSVKDQLCIDKIDALCGNEGKTLAVTINTNGSCNAVATCWQDAEPFSCTAKKVPLELVLKLRGNFNSVSVH